MAETATEAASTASDPHRIVPYENACIHYEKRASSMASPLFIELTLPEAAAPAEGRMAASVTK